MDRSLVLNSEGYLREHSFAQATLAGYSQINSDSTLFAHASFYYGVVWQVLQALILDACCNVIKKVSFAYDCSCILDIPCVY